MTTKLPSSLQATELCYEQTKCIEIDCHTIQHWISSSLISVPHVSSFNQLSNILTKGPSLRSSDTFSCKLGLFDLYNQTRGSVRMSGCSDSIRILLSLALYMNKERYIPLLILFI